MVRFGVFEVDLGARELRKRGIRLRLQDQPFRVLEALVERPGEVITREQLKDRLWAQDEFVEFDKSLNTAIQKIRQALGDSAESPRFLETIPRVGYRFLAPIAEAQPIRSTSVEAQSGRSRMIAAGAALVGVALFWAGWATGRRSPAESALDQRQVVRFTVESAEAVRLNQVRKLLAISPDGARIAFVAGDLETRLEMRSTRRSEVAQTYSARTCPTG